MNSRQWQGKGGRGKTSAQGHGGARGASQSKTKIRDRTGSYLANHRLVAMDSLKRLLALPIQSLLTWLVIAIALALPTGLYLTITNIQNMGQGWESGIHLSVFLNPRAKPEAIAQLQEELSARPDLVKVSYVSPDEALEEFERHSGLNGVVASLDNNPLPPVLILYPAEVLESGGGGSHAESLSTEEILRQLQVELSDKSLVDDVRLDMAWVQRLAQIMEIAQRFILVLGGLLCVGVLLVIGNTIGLAIESRREEIVIVKLVGGTNAFVRRPFLYTGLWYGLGGGLLAVVLISLGLWALSGPVNKLVALYQGSYTLSGLKWMDTMAVLLGSATLGWLGAGFSVSKHLHRIEPN